MTPIEAAVKALREANNPTAEGWAREIITAFLDAAAGDERLSRQVGLAPIAAETVTYDLMGKAAILKLKEAVNG